MLYIASNPGKTPSEVLSGLLAAAAVPQGLRPDGKAWEDSLAIRISRPAR